MTRATASEGLSDGSCQLCEAARMSEWFHDDELCWVAECESCSVPMVVWKQHDPNPPEEVRAVLVSILAQVVEQHFESEYWVDDSLRSIPDHYHAHARPRGSFFGYGLRRKRRSDQQGFPIGFMSVSS